MDVFRQYAYEETSADDHVVYFDMDGTVADLYAVDGWQEMLDSYDPYPYVYAEPMIDYLTLQIFAETLHDIGWKIGILSWLSKESTPEFDAEVIEAKLDWIDNFFPMPDEVVIAPHSVPKYEIVIPEEAILIDDEGQNRMHWDASGPFRRSYPADELDQLTALLHASYDDAMLVEDVFGAGGSEPTTAEDLMEIVTDRMAWDIGDENRVPLVVLESTDGAEYSIVFMNSSGTGWFSPYQECCIPIADPYNLTQDEIGRVLARADRLVYDIT